MTVMTFHFPGRRSVATVLLASVALVTLLAAVASAYWRATGSGAGTAATGTALTVTISNAGVSPAADLHPGATASVTFKLDNRLSSSGNSFGATFNKVTAASVVSSSDEVACPHANVTVAPSLPYTFTPAVTVGGNSLSAAETISGLVRLATAAPNGCQGKTFTISLTLSGTST